MGHVKEPVGVDLNIGPMALSAEDRQALSMAIAQYKLTKEVPKSKLKMGKEAGSKKATATGAKNRKPATKKSVVMSSK